MFTLSNLITFLRVVLLPPIIISILKENMQTALILILISYLTDIADGYIARKLKQESEFGKIIDPLADKITFIVVLACLSIIKRFPIWAMAPLIAREGLIISGGLYLVATGRKVIPASILGKITGWVFGVMVVVYIVNFRPLLTITLYTALVIMVISFISYAQQFILRIKGRGETE